MEPSREESYKKFQQIRDKYPRKKIGDANEAETRLLIINNILEALGWEKEDFNPETPVTSGTSIDYLDYQLKASDIPRLVVEAKRIGHTFAHPRHNLKKNEYQLLYLQNAFGAALGEVLEQAKRYTTKTRIPFAVITNGAEWMLLQLNPPPGKTINDLNGFYLGNVLDSECELNFDLFWRLLSKHCVENRGLEEAFNEINSIESDYAYEVRPALGDLSISGLSPPGGNFMRDYYDRFFDEISDNRRREMLNHCFVTSAKLEQYEGELKRTLADTAPSYLSRNPAAKVGELSPEDDKAIVRDTSGDQKGRVVLIVGAVGAGKTTFITRAIINNRGSGINFVRIDLINEGVDQSVSTELLWKLVYKRWLEGQDGKFTHEKLAAIFDSEIRSMKTGPRGKIYAKDLALFEQDEANLLDSYYKDPEVFVTKSFRHYDRAFSQSVVLILDNVDRTSEQYQKMVYAFAHKVADNTGCLVIITMRESTYFRGREGDFLDVRTSDKVFHLKAPDPLKVLARRIDYIETRIDDDHRVREWRKSGEWDEFRSQAQKLARQQKASLLTNGEDGKNAISLLSALAWHSIRYFFSSLEYVHSQVGPDDKWNFRDILMTLMFPSESGGVHSVATSLFHPIEKHHKCFFLRIRVLLLLQYGVRQDQRRAGVRAHRIVDYCRSYGYRTSWIKKTIESLVRERLLECLEIPTEPEHTKNYSFSDKHTFSPSPLAVVLLEKILASDEYLICSMWDLPFHDSDIRALFIKLADGTDLRILSQNSKLTRLSVEYLLKLRQHESLLNDASSYGSEVVHCEERLNVILKQLAAAHAIDDLPKTRRMPPSILVPAQKQLSLGGINIEESPTDPFQIKLIPIPENITKVVIRSTRTPPLVFWSLANAKAGGIDYLSGTEITKMINMHLLDDQQKLAATNVSKSMRGSVMRSQPWLRHITAANGHSAFSLSKDWKSHWIDVFKSEAPDV